VLKVTSIGDFSVHEGQWKLNYAQKWIRESYCY